MFGPARAQGAPIALSLVLGLLLLGSCAPARARDAGGPDAKPTDVRIVITEGAITSTSAEFGAGLPYRLIVSNKGVMTHELLVMPPVQPGALTHEAMWGLALGAIYERDLPPGGLQVTTIVFDKAYPPGTLEFACHIAGHYEAGQRLPIVVEPQRSVGLTSSD